MKAIILAAGKGTRLHPLTLDKPKCLLNVGEKTIIDRLVANLRDIGCDDILFIVGHQKEHLINHFGSSVRFREYADFDKTNNLHTLWSVEDELNEPFICSFADIILEPEALALINESRDDFALAVDTKQVLESTMRIQIQNGRVSGIGSQIPVDQGSGNFIGLAKFSQKGAQALKTQMGDMVTGYKDDYYTMAIHRLAKRGQAIGYVDIKDYYWAEIDTQQDLEKVREYLSGKS